jgi:hypothetical protein
MNLDKNNLDLELLDELAMKIVVAKYGIDCFYTDSSGDEHLTYDAESYYSMALEDLTDLLTRWLEARDNAPDSPHQLNPPK